MAPPAIARSRLVADLRALGLREGSAVLVHARMSALGWVVGGSGAVVSAVLEALVLRGALGMNEDDIAAQRGVSYAKSTPAALEAVESGAVDAAFFMAPTPIEQVQAVAAAGESMPPKSTFFYPKVPTGLVFSPLE